MASQAQLVIDTASAKKLPTMFHDQALVASGALASYGQSYFEIGRRSAKYVRQILNGVSPADQRVETIEDVELAFNLKTAKANRRDDPAERAHAGGEGGAVTVTSGR